MPKCLGSQPIKVKLVLCVCLCMICRGMAIYGGSYRTLTPRRSKWYAGDTYKLTGKFVEEWVRLLVESTQCLVENTSLIWVLWLGYSEPCAFSLVLVAPDYSDMPIISVIWLLWDGRGPPELIEEAGGSPSSHFPCERNFRLRILFWHSSK